MWKVSMYNASKYTLAANGDWPVKPGALIGSCLDPDESTVRNHMRMWLRSNYMRDRKITLSWQDSEGQWHLMETHDKEGRLRA